ncbi:hypothetical protein [Azotobacter armeniacus]
MNSTLDTQRASQTQHRTRQYGTGKIAPHPVLILLGAALALLLLTGGTRLLLAGIASYQAEPFPQDWEKKGQEPSELAWQIAHNAAQRAIAFYPSTSGAYQHRLGQIHHWQQLHQPLGAPAAAPSRRAALVAFRAATETRPSWPAHYWTALTWAKLQLLEFDNEFHRALAEAQRLSPWHIVINPGLAEVGLIA